MARGEPLIRQWNLLKTIQNHRFGISTEELAERLECSRRQVQRDLNLMQQIGFPISFEQRDFGKRFWKLAPQFIEREGLLLSVTEMLSLFLSQKLLAPLAGTQLGDGLSTALEKIKAHLPSKTLAYFGSLGGTLVVKNIAYHDYTAHAKEVSIFSQAITDRRVVKVRYASPRAVEPFEALFHPYGFVMFGVNLYCVGRLVGHGDVRTLKLSRCQGVELTAETFDPPGDFSLSTYLQGSFGIMASGEPQTVRVRFTDWAATSVREQQWHCSQKIIDDAGGCVVAEYRLNDTTEFKRWLLGFGRHAMVLVPKKLAADIAGELAAAHAAYAPPATPATLSARENGAPASAFRPEKS